MCSHALLILAKLSKSKKSIGATTKVKLNIPQLTLVKLAQLGRHQSGSHEVPGSIPIGGKEPRT